MHYRKDASLVPDRMLVLGFACPYIQMCVIQMCVSSSSMHVLFGSIPGGLTERQSYGDTACINLDTCIFVAQAAAEAKITAPERKRKAAAQDQKKKKIQRSHCKTQIQVFFIVIVIIASQKGCITRD